MSEFGALSLDDNDLQKLALATRITSSLSLIACVAMLVDILRTWRKLSATPSRVMLWWTLADLIIVAATLSSRSFIESMAGTPSAGCTLQGWMIQFGFIASALWAGVMATNIFLAICKRMPLSEIQHYERYYHMVVWGVSFIMATVPLIITRIQSSGGVRVAPFYDDSILWCWISSSWSPYRIALFYGPVWVILLFIMGIYVKVGHSVRQVFAKLNGTMNSSSGGNTGNDTSQSSKKALRARLRFTIKASMYIAVFVLTFIPASVQRVSTLLGAEPRLALLMPQAILMPLEAFSNALVYFVSYLFKDSDLNSQGESVSNDPPGVNSARPLSVIPAYRSKPGTGLPSPGHQSSSTSPISSYYDRKGSVANSMELGPVSRGANAQNYPPPSALRYGDDMDAAGDAYGYQPYGAAYQQRPQGPQQIYPSAYPYPVSPTYINHRSSISPMPSPTGPLPAIPSSGGTAPRGSRAGAPGSRHHY